MIVHGHIASRALTGRHDDKNAQDGTSEAWNCLSTGRDALILVLLGAWQVVKLAYSLAKHRSRALVASADLP